MDWQPEDLVEEIHPKPGHAHTHTVIFLHGRGDTARNFRRCLDDEAGGRSAGAWTDSRRRSPMAAFPTFRWVFPTAGVKPCARGGAASQWFDLWDHVNLRDREELQAPGLRDSVARVRVLVAREAGRLGGRYDKIVLMGISQGGATGVHTLFNLAVPEGFEAAGGRPRRLGAFVGVSCRLPFSGRPLEELRTVLGLDGVPKSDEMVRNTPVLLEHCADDQTVLVESGRQMRDALQGFGATLAWKEYPDGGHWFKSPQGLDDLAEFLGRVLPTD